MINVAEILKDCPKGMELDCTMFNGLYFDHIDAKSCYPIKCRAKRSDGEYNIYAFDKYGHWIDYFNAKCVIFPKDKTTWEGFVPPCKFKDGDILATDLGSVFFLNTRLNTDGYYGCYVGIDSDGSFRIYEPFAYKECCGLANEEEKQKLFYAIKENGYKWNVETKTLNKLVEPKFKVGDRIKNSDNCRSSIVVGIKDDCFIIKTLDGFQHSYLTDKLPFSKQDEWELATNKFDITTLKPFDKVLVRGDVGQRWIIDFFDFMDNNKGYPFVCVGHYVAQCIPFEGNEHLLGKTDDCDEYYKTWQ